MRGLRHLLVISRTQDQAPILLITNHDQYSLRECLSACISECSLKKYILYSILHTAPKLTLSDAEDGIGRHGFFTATDADDGNGRHL